MHDHQHLARGENTLNLQLAGELIASLLDRGSCGAADHLDRHVAFTTTPGHHRDTYIEECHRGFFTRYAEGRPPTRCAVEDIPTGGLAGFWPTVVR